MYLLCFMQLYIIVLFIIFSILEIITCIMPFSVEASIEVHSTLYDLIF